MPEKTQHSISHTVLETIKKEHVTPKPRWYFIFWHSLLWLTLALIVVTGSLGVGLLFEDISSTEWDLSYKLAGNIGTWLFLFFPYIWVFVLLVALLLAYKAFSATPNGYRHKPVLVVAIAVFCSFGGGFILQQTGAAVLAEKKIQEYIQPYAHLKQTQAGIFVAPQHGVIGGNIINVSSPSIFVLKDISGKNWTITIKNIPPKPLSFIKKNRKVIVIGAQTSPTTFDAQYIRLWKPPIHHHNLSIIFLQKNKVKELPRPPRITERSAL